MSFENFLYAYALMCIGRVRCELKANLIALNKKDLQTWNGSHVQRWT